MKPSEAKSIQELNELSSLYQGVYEQLTDLKHFIYSSTHLSELEPLAVLVSKHIKDRIKLPKNAVWLALEPNKVHETAGNGKLVDPDKRRSLDLESSGALKRVVLEQLVVWPERFKGVKGLFPEFKSPMLFPIKGKSMAFGFFAIDQLPAEKQEVMQFLSQFAGMIFNMSCLHQELSDQKKELSEMTDILFTQNVQMASLYHMSLEISKSRDPFHLCRLVTETAVREFGAVTAAAFIVNKDSNELVGASENGGLHDIENLRLNLEGTDAIRKAMESGRISSCKDNAPELQLGPNRLKNWIVVPLKGGGVTRGVLVTEIGEMDITDPITIVANYAGLMLDKLMAMEALSCSNVALERLSTIDYLTGLYNHRYFQERFKTEFSRARRYKHSLALIMIDLDHFKSVNDRFGHAVGDQVLKEVARRTGKVLRDADIVTRYGGEEIAVILPETAMASARVAAEKIRSAVFREPVSANGASIRISISLGVAAFPSPRITSREELFSMADQAMYQAKGAGRNCVKAAE